MHRDQKHGLITMRLFEIWTAMDSCHLTFLPADVHALHKRHCAIDSTSDYFLLLIIAKAITEGPSHGADRVSEPALICPLCVAWLLLLLLIDTLELATERVAKP